MSAPGYSEVQLVHRGQRHLVYRARSGEGGRRVALKVAAPEATARDAVALRHEFEVLSELHLDGVVEAHTLKPLPDGVALELNDAGNESLLQRVARGPLPLDEFFPAALQLTQALARVHQRGIVHRDINPANAVWEPETGKVTLIDFGLATTVAATRAAGGAPAQLEGTLPYLAPEQTGRTGHPVDARSDLYALGCTCYELLTGRPPFVLSDPMELIHAHLAVEPVPAHARRPEVPEGLSLIIQKLLAKPPEDRYQTDRALLHDLERASALWKRTGEVPEFLLAQRDVPERLVVPEKLYGRERAREVLLRAFGEVCGGRTTLVLVTGDPGIGKSALVKQLGRAALERHGVFLEGKFDSLERAVPFAAVAEALKTLVHTMLAEPEATLSAWRGRLGAALGANARSMTDLVPDLGLVLGPQPPLPAAGPTEACERLARTLEAFLAATALPERPLVLFLDDLQWIDAGSLFLVKALVGALEPRALMLVGAYRAQEVSPAHPLARAIAELERAGLAPTTLHLGPLAPDAVDQLVADALRLAPPQVRSLSTLVAQRTGGNPFFVRRLLMSLEARGLLHFDSGEGRWTWDPRQLEQVQVTDNLGELLGESLEHLPPETRDLLSAAACVGHRFELMLLARMRRRAVVETAAALWPAIDAGLLVPLGDAARLPLKDWPDQAFAGLVFRFEFAHDRVQQAAYLRLPSLARQTMHLRIGRCLLESGPGGALFDAVDHLDRAAELVEDAAERTRLAELNLRAGLEAMKAAAHGVALRYLTAGTELLTSSSWDAVPGLAGALHRERARCAYVNGEHPLAESLIAAALPHVRTASEAVALLRIRIDSATVTGDFARAVAAGREALALLGVELPFEAVAAAAAAEVGETVRALSRVSIAALVDAPELVGAEALLRVQVLASLATPAYLHDPDLFALLQARMVRTCLAEGVTVEASQGWATYAIVHGAASGDWATAHELGRLAVSLARRFGNPAYLCRVLHVFANHINHWRSPLVTDVPLFREAIRSGLESGEMQFAGHAATGLVNHLFPAGEELSVLAEELERAAAFVARHGNRSMTQVQTAFRQAIRCLQGKTRTPPEFDDEDFDEARFLGDARENRTARCCYLVLRLQVAYLFGDLAAARRLAGQAEALLPSALGLFTYAEHAFYAGLTFASCAAEAAAGERAALVEQAQTQRRRLDGWAVHCAENFRHKERLVAAELARLEGRPWEALGLYDEAIDGARQSGFLQDEALANERASSLLALAGRRRAARPYLRAAREAYERWGASAKVASLDATKPPTGVSTRGASSSVISSSEQTLDSLSLMKAARAISSEVFLEGLLESLMPILLEAAGAERGTLLLVEGGGLEVRARASALAPGVTREATGLGEALDLPRGVVEYVRRTRKPLALSDARQEGPFTAEPDVLRRGVRSVLCTPVRTPARELGVLYLENNALPGAFGPDREEVVGLLAAQVATSLENARLFERLGHESEARARALATAQQAIEVRDEFLQVAAHELRTPLATLKLRLEALRRRGAPPPAELARGVDQAMRQVDRLSLLVTSLLDVARLARGRLELSREEVDLSALVREVAERMSVDAERAGSELRVKSGPRLVGRWDPLRIEQVLQNLFSNALKFGAGQPVDVEVREEGNRALVLVRDHGPGIAAADVERIFGRFERAVSTRHYGGLGLGLYIARQLAEAHRGSIRVETRQGEGSTFVLELPR